MSDKIYVVKAYIEEIEESRDISKYVANKFRAKQIAQQMKDAAHLLGLGDVFQCELKEEELEE